MDRATGQIGLNIVSNIVSNILLFSEKTETNKERKKKKLVS
jgi:hypothetical protein